MADVRDTILDYLRSDLIRDQRIEYDTPLITSGFVHSLEMAGVKSYLESRYRIKIPDELATPQAFDSVENITRLLSKLGVR
jgi:acyl carrier protein